MIKVLFFAQLREQLNCAEILLDEQNLRSVADIQQQLIKEHPQWEKYLLADNLLTAVNQTLTRVGQPVVAGDEVAFFPPVTGG